MTYHHSALSAARAASGFVRISEPMQLVQLFKQKAAEIQAQPVDVESERLVLERHGLKGMAERGASRRSS